MLEDLRAAPDPERLPFPVSALLDLADQSAPAARPERLVAAFERGLGFATSVFVAAYLLHLRREGSRLADIDRSLATLHLPSLGSWVQVLRAFVSHLPSGTHDVADRLRDALPLCAIDDAGRVVSLRNRRIHRYDFSAETNDAIQAGARAFLARLQTAEDLRVTAVIPRGDRYDLGGLRPRRSDAPARPTDPPSPAPRVFAATGPDAPALDLSPVVLAVGADAPFPVDVLLYAGRRRNGSLMHVGLQGEPPATGRPDRDELAGTMDLLLDPEAVPLRYAPTEAVTEPFRRLREFEPWDQDVFCGREIKVRDLAEMVDDHRLVVLHGASGTGKTSLLQAGLCPARDTRYVWLKVTPGDDVLAQVVRSATREIELRGRAPEAEAPHQLLLELSRLAGHPVLLVIDQAEEMFQGRSEERIRSEAEAVAREIRKCWDAGRVRGDVHVLLSLRDDYFSSLGYLHDAGLRDVFDNRLGLRPLDRSGARQAIEEPLRQAGMSLAPGLAERILTDLSGHESEVSPVELELVCDELYQTAREGGRTEIGPDLYRGRGAGEVLARYVQARLGALAGDAAAARALLKQMLSATGRRREPATIAALVEPSKLPAERVRSLLEILVDDRLVQAAEVADARGEARYRIAHDLVAREVFERLTAEEKRDLEIRERLTLRTDDWLRAGQPRWWFPVPPAARNELLAWRSGRDPGGTKDERSFLGALAKWDRRARILRRGWPLAAAALVVAAVLFGWRGWRKAEEEEARGREMAAQRAEAEARRELVQDPGKAIAWIREAARLRGGVRAEPEEQLARQWLLARAAWEQGIGWVVARHEQEVRAVAFSPASPDGRPCPACWPNRKLLVSAGRDGAVRLLDLDAGGEATALPDGHEAGATDVAFSPDGRWIASAGGDGTVRVWDTASRKSAAVLRLPGIYEYYKVAFSPDNGVLAAGSLGGDILAWSVGSWGMLLQGWREGPASVTALAFQPRKDRLLCSGFDDGFVAVTDVPRSGTVSGPLRHGLSADQTELAGVQSLAFSRDVSRLAVAGLGRGPIRLFAAPFDGSPVAAVDPGGGTVTAVAFGFTLGALLFSGDQSGQVVMWRPESATGSWIRDSRLFDHDAVVTGLQVTPDSRWVLSASEDGTLALAYYRASLGRRVLRGHFGRVLASAFSPDGTLVASGGLDGEVRLWPAASGRTDVVAAASADSTIPVRSLTATDPAHLVVAGLQSGQLAVWRDLGVEREAQLLSAHSLGIVRVCLLGEDRIASAGWDKTIRVLSVPNGHTEQALAAEDAVQSLLCLPQGGFVAGTEGGGVYLWAAGTGTPVPLGRQRGRVGALVLAADGRTVASGSSDGTVVLWDVPGRNARRTLNVGQPVHALAALADGGVLFTVQDGTVRRWYPSTGSRTILSVRHFGEVHDVAVSPEDRLLASAGDDGVRLSWLGAGASDVLAGTNGVASAVTFARDGSMLVSGENSGAVRIWQLPPTERGEFDAWLARQAPWRVEDGRPVANTFPGLGHWVLEPSAVQPDQRDAGEPASGPPDGEAPSRRARCEARCREDEGTGALRSGVTLEDCYATCAP